MKKNRLITALILTFSSLANAQTWVEVTQPSAAGVSDLEVINNKLYIASSYGVFSSADDVLWDTLTNGMAVTAGFTFSSTIYNYNNVLYSGASNGVMYKSIDFGANWTSVIGAASSASTNRAVYVNGNTVLMGWSSSPALRISADGGSTWSTTNMPSISKEIVELNGNIFIYTVSGIYKSSDNGATVTQLAGGLPAYSGSGGGIIKINGTLVSTIYNVGTYTSSDEGVSWTSIGTAEGLISTFGVSFLVDGNTLYLSCSQGKVFKSLDNGSTWTDMTGTGINTTYVINTLAVFNGYLYAGTNVLYKTAVSTSTGVSESVEIESLIYPNPVSDDVFTIKRAGKYDVSIYNLSGQLVFSGRNLVNNSTINIENIATGSYVIKIVDNNQVETKKLIIN